jgi:hypothetical protein
MRLARFRFHRYLAMVSIDNDPAHDVETESGAFARLFGGKERIEDPGRHGRRNMCPDPKSRRSTKVFRAASGSKSVRSVPFHSRHFGHPMICKEQSGFLAGESALTEYFEWLSVGFSTHHAKAL